MLEKKPRNRNVTFSGTKSVEEKLDKFRVGDEESVKSLGAKGDARLRPFDKQHSATFQRNFRKILGDLRDTESEKVWGQREGKIDADSHTEMQRRSMLKQPLMTR